MKLSPHAGKLWAFERKIRQNIRINLIDGIQCSEFRSKPNEIFKEVRSHPDHDGSRRCVTVYEKITPTCSRTCSRAACNHSAVAKCRAFAVYRNKLMHIIIFPAICLRLFERISRAKGISFWSKTPPLWITYRDTHFPGHSEISLMGDQQK